MQYFAVRKVLWRNFRSLLQRGVVPPKEKLLILNNMFFHNAISKAEILMKERKCYPQKVSNFLYKVPGFIFKTATSLYKSPW